MVRLHPFHRFGTSCYCFWGVSSSAQAVSSLCNTHYYRPLTSTAFAPHLSEIRRRSCSSFPTNKNNHHNNPLQMAPGSSMDSSSSSRDSVAIVQITDKVISQVQSELKSNADPEKAVSMQKYMKTEMPFYGIPQPQRVSLAKKTLYPAWEHEIEQSSEFGFVFQDDDDGDEHDATATGRRTATTHELYRHMLQALWKLPHREEKYLAIDFATHYTTRPKQSKKRKRTTPDLTVDGKFFVDLYLDMLRADYMWWDLCDPLATHVVSPILLQHRSFLEPQIRKDWMSSSCLWIQRTALLAQLPHKHDTDPQLLWDTCRTCCGWDDDDDKSSEFFLDKAAGWALREYSKTNPRAVQEFLNRHRSDMSTLTYREAAKHLIKSGYSMDK